MQSDQLLRRTGLAHQDKVQTGRQTSQVTVTVTHNREERRRDGRHQRTGRTERGDGGGQEAREGADPPPMTEGGEDGGQRDHREGGRGNGGGLGGWEPGARESAPRLGACDWPRVAMVARAAFTGTHCSSCGVGGAGGGGGVLVVRIVLVRSGSCLQVSLKGAKDRQKTGMRYAVCDFCAPF